MANNRQAFIEGLRAMAQFLEEHPIVPVPTFETMNSFVRDKDTLAMIARAASWQKVYLGEWFVLRREFGGDLMLDITTERDRVCRKVVRGTRVVPAVPAQPERVVEEYAWVCDDEPLLV